MRRSKKRPEIIEAPIEPPIGSYRTYDDILRRRQAFVAARKACFGERFNRMMAGEASRRQGGGKDRHGLEDAAGVYAARLETGDFSATRWMAQVK